jgi:hypothetical protein
MIAPNCTQFKHGACCHPAAPRKWLTRPDCILVYPLEDVRVPEGCALQVPHVRPPAPERGSYAIRPIILQPERGPYGPP